MCRGIDDILEELHGVSAMAVAEKNTASWPVGAPAAGPSGSAAGTGRQPAAHLGDADRGLSLWIIWCSVWGWRCRKSAGALMMMEMKKVVRPVCPAIAMNGVNLEISFFGVKYTEGVMNVRSTASLIAWFVVIGLDSTTGTAQTFIHSDFSKGDFIALGWKAKGDWDVFQYPIEAANNPGPVARFGANRPGGCLTKTFAEIKNPNKLTLALDYGWGWGADQGSDSVSLMLLDAIGSGYVFEVHRCKATWAVQWAKVADAFPPGSRPGRPRKLTRVTPSVERGGLSHPTITRDSDGAWSIASKDWNKRAVRH